MYSNISLSSSTLLVLKIAFLRAVNGFFERGGTSSKAMYSSDNNVSISECIVVRVGLKIKVSLFNKKDTKFSDLFIHKSILFFGTMVLVPF
ncbi:hypothetical protein ES707_13048 [subsurface metagenome]